MTEATPRSAMHTPSPPPDVTLEIPQTLQPPSLVSPGAGAAAADDGLDGTTPTLAMVSSPRDVVIGNRTPVKSPRRDSPTVVGKLRGFLSGKTSHHAATEAQRRPEGMPQKTPAEIREHKKAIEEMRRGWKKKEKREGEDREKRRRQCEQRELFMHQALNKWRQDILPQWELKRGQRSTKKLWKKGIPPQLREEVWALSIGNSLSITRDLFAIFQAKARQARALHTKRIQEQTEQAVAATRRLQQQEEDGSTPTVEQEARGGDTPRPVVSPRKDDGRGDTGAAEAQPDRSLSRSPPLATSLPLSPTSPSRSDAGSFSSGALSPRVEHESASDSEEDNDEHDDAVKQLALDVDEGSASRRSVLRHTASMGTLLCREDTAELILLDLHRTFPHLQFLQEGPKHEALLSVLDTYVQYRPDVGYVQGMSYLAAMLLLYLETYEAFVAMANMLANSHFLSFFRMNAREMNVHIKTFDMAMRDQMPQLHKHFQSVGLPPELYCIDWFVTLFSRSLSLDLAARIWDLYFLNPTAMYKAALSLIMYFQSTLIRCTFERSFEFLTHLPKEIDENRFFDCFFSITISTKKFMAIQREATRTARDEFGT